VNLQTLEPGFAIADALSPADLEEVSRQGFRTVICNRRPGESEDHPGEQAFAAEAERLGLKWVSIPVASGEYSQADVASFRRTLEEAPAPILAFCRKRETLNPYVGPRHELSNPSATFPCYSRLRAKRDRIPSQSANCCSGLASN